MSATIERRFHPGTARGRGGGSRRTLASTPAPVPGPERLSDDPDRVHPLARRMAMAIRCQQLIDSGVVADQASLAAGMTRAWVTVVMRLNLLAPDIQEEILEMGPDSPADHRALDRVARVASWRKQRVAWRSRKDAHASHQYGSRPQ
ncbi:MAG: hypothetical protein PF961_19690 [Planctomycetota bacterium]|jgi:hypothetical protein|nr:hypothetical protein [Planctomycetota bacterium]